MAFVTKRVVKQTSRQSLESGHCGSGCHKMEVFKRRKMKMGEVKP